MLLYPGYLDKGPGKTLTPGIAVGANTPPVFIFSTADDGATGSSLAMATALRDAKIPVELHMLPEGGHGYGLRKGNIAGETWPQLAAVWLSKLKL